MNCSEAERHLPGYLDGAVQPRHRARVREHLSTCEGCRQQLETYRQMATHLAHVEPVSPPPDLALRIRVRASKTPAPWSGLQRLWSRAVMIFEDILEPLAVPATGGVLTALVIFALVVQNVLVGVPMGAVPNDLPLNLVQPAQLESLAPFPIPGIITAEGQPDPNPSGLLLEATLNAQGQVVFYKILSGPNNVAVQHQIDQVLLFSRFRPTISFGLPVSGGRVFLNFSSIHVRG
jgi:Putative zinc-finger